MPKVTNKIEVFGDSACTVPPGGTQSRAARIYARNPAKFGGAGFRDNAIGGQSYVKNFQGIAPGGGGMPGWGGLDFPGYISTISDADICILSLGGNDTVTGINSAGNPTDYGNGVLQADVQTHVGTDCLNVAAFAFQHIQWINAAGKRPFVVGLPYVNVVELSTPGVGPAPTMTLEEAKGAAARVTAINAALRVACGLTSTPFLAVYGAPLNSGQPAAGPGSNRDGIHPTNTYANALGDFIADRIIATFGL